MRLPHATALVIGTIIGASIFVQPSEVTTQVHSVGAVLLVWLLSGAVTLIGALICAELASTFTRTGGVYVYLSESFHPALGFLWGWAMLLTMHSGILAAIAQDVELRGGRTARRLVSAGVVGVTGAIGAVLIVSTHPFDHHPHWHEMIFGAVWSGILVVSVALGLMGERTKTFCAPCTILSKGPPVAASAAAIGSKVGITANEG